MEQSLKKELVASVSDFRMPRYDEIPNVGLFLEQTTSYIADYFKSFENINVTGSMISNYVKKGIIDNPVKKQYYRDQIAYLFFIVVAKTVLSLEDIQLMISVQKKTYTTKRAYEYFVREFENILLYIYGLKDELEVIGNDDSDEKIMLRNTIVTVAHKVYLDKCFSLLHQE
ncbi:MAG: DUF1836 domain-containing protein [Lachnospiraceae bacterium]|nr:DUF1836 domain-containing protein [Lachnospiraceae bacterium]